jgi:hypothetical protein
MSKAPKRPSNRDDFKPSDTEGGAPRSQASARKPRSAPKRKAESVLENVRTEMPSGAMERVDRTASSNVLPVQDAPRAEARTLIADGEPMRENHRGARIEAQDGAQQQVQAIALGEPLSQKEPDQGATSDLPQPDLGIENQVHPEQVPSQPQSEQPNFGLEQRRDIGEPIRNALLGHAQRAIGVWSPRVRTASGRVKVWTQEVTARRAQRAHRSNEPANPIYLLAGITLGIPALLMIPLIGMNPGVQDGSLTSIVTFLAISAFVIAMIFEIKRIADHPSDGDHP